MANALPITEQRWPYERAEETAFALEGLLRRHCIAIQPGSPLESAVLNAMLIAERKRSGVKAVGDEDVRDSYRVLAGIHELSNLILSVRDHPSFTSLLPHLRLLNDGAALQNTKSHSGDSVTNKLFELLMAAIAMNCGSDVVLDDPIRSDGTNPDILATLGGRRWGIACKVLHSTHPEGFLEHLRKGLQQIEKSPAETGVVAFNLKNVLPHSDIWPLASDNEGTGLYPAAWTDPNAAYAFFFQAASEIGRRLDASVDNVPAVLANEFAGKKSVPAFLLWAHSVCGLLIKGKPAPTSLRALIAVQVLDEVELYDERVLACLNWAAFHDSAGRGSKPHV